MCHCMIGARTLGGALQLAARFESLLFPQTGLRVSLTRRCDTAVLQYHVEVDPESALAPQHWDRADYQDTVAKASGLLIWQALSGWLVGESLITLDLPTGLPSFAEISSHLHMSESSLRRRLQKENTSYQKLKDEVRCQVAIDKLVNNTIKVADLSDFLGFTEPSSFVRSFKNWTGETPKSYREKMRALAAN